MVVDARRQFLDVACAVYFAYFIWTVILFLTTMQQPSDLTPDWKTLVCLTVPMLASMTLGFSIGLLANSESEKSLVSQPLRRSYGAVDEESWPIAASGNTEKE